MEGKFYIPNLSKIQEELNSDSKALILSDEPNVVNFDSEEAYQHFLDNINSIEYIHDKELKKVIFEAVPELADEFSHATYSIQDLRDGLGHIFEDLPDKAFEGKNIVEAIKLIFNNFIRKNENTFLAINIGNGNLRYDDTYKFKKNQVIYYDMMKTEYNLEVYYDFITRVTQVLRRIFLRQILFDDSPITDKKRELLNRAFNVSGNMLVDFQENMDGLKSELKGHKITLKRTNIPVLPEHKTIESRLLDKIDSVIEDSEEQIKKIHESKKQLAEEIKKRHGIFSIETAKKLLREVKWLKPFIKE